MANTVNIHCDVLNTDLIGILAICLLANQATAINDPKPSTAPAPISISCIPATYPADKNATTSAPSRNTVRNTTVANIIRGPCDFRLFSISLVCTEAPWQNQAVQNSNTEAIKAVPASTYLKSDCITSMAKYANITLDNIASATDDNIVICCDLFLIKFHAICTISQASNPSLNQINVDASVPVIFFFLFNVLVSLIIC